MPTTAFFSSYDAVGVKEEVSDIISNISPTKTPFQTAIGNEKLHQKLFQWQEDSLKAPAANAQIEGADASPASVPVTVMRQNLTQILSKAVKVTGTMDVTSTYGRAKESAYQMAKASAEIKRDLEVAFVGMGFQAQTVGTGTSVARKMGVYQAMLGFAGSTSQYGTGGDNNGAGGNYTNIVYSGTLNVVSEANILTALQNCYNNGAEPNTVSIVPADAITVAGFALSASASGFNAPRIRDSGSSTQVVNAVTMYKSPFGEVKFVLNRFQSGAPLSLSPPANAKHVLIYDPSMWSKQTLRPWFREVLAKTGDSLNQMLLGEFSLKHKNFLASAAIIEKATPATTVDMTLIAQWQ